MSNKSNVIVDPHFLMIGEIFSPQDKSRLYNLIDVIWGSGDR